MVCWCMLIKLHLWMVTQHTANEWRQGELMFSQLGLGHNSNVLDRHQILPNNSKFNHTAVCLLCWKVWLYVMCDFMGVCNNVFYWQFAKVCAWRAYEVMMRWRGRCLPLVSRALLFCPNSPVPTRWAALAHTQTHTHAQNQSFLHIHKHAFTDYFKQS